MQGLAGVASLSSVFTQKAEKAVAADALTRMTAAIGRVKARTGPQTNNLRLGFSEAIVEQPSGRNRPVGPAAVKNAPHLCDLVILGLRFGPSQARPIDLPEAGGVETVADDVREPRTPESVLGRGGLKPPSSRSTGSTGSQHDRPLRRLRQIGTRRHHFHR